MKNVRSLRTGPPVCAVKRLYSRVGFDPPARSVRSGVDVRLLSRLKYAPAPCTAFVPLLSARLTTAPAVWPDCASNALVCTLNSAIASDGGEKPTPRAFERFGAPSML